METFWPHETQPCGKPQFSHGTAFHFTFFYTSLFCFFLFRSAYKILVRKLKGRVNWEDLGIDRKVLEWTLVKYGGKVWTACIWLNIETGGGLL